MSEMQELVKGLTVYYEDRERQLLHKISSDLRAEYEDFAASINDQMDVELGEIYREKLRHVFRILADNGIVL